MDIEFIVTVFLIVAVFIAAALIFYGMRRMYESKRSEALRSVALSLGMLFEDGRDIDATKRFGAFQLFSRGSKEKVRNCLSGTIDGVDVTTFGYEYTVAGVGATSTYRQTVVLFRSNELSLPKFELQSRTIVMSLFESLDDHINFDAHPYFSMSYYLRGRNESAIRHVFSSRVLEYFESHKGLSVEGRDERLLCYRADSPRIRFRGARVKPDELKRFLDEERAVFGLFRMKP